MIIYKLRKSHKTLRTQSKVLGETKDLNFGHSEHFEKRLLRLVETGTKWQDAKDGNFEEKIQIFFSREEMIQLKKYLKTVNLGDEDGQ